MGNSNPLIEHRPKVELFRGTCYLCDHDNGQDIAFAEGQVLLCGALKVVPGHALCALWPWCLREREGK